ncbi:hypothetical protein FMJ36_08200 [Klebsiella michiganensis]|uniref:hypothetical protein n=1 Tax=Klebsiella michiganensis TaxID=1134687 RepID=UPI001CCBD94A|nr:hypothetical protein [Klebsiella michiganensis]MBZ7497992.1 hypothetical protein [Klebsiella michiganensis]
MNLKSRIKLLEQHAKSSASDTSVCQPPPDKALFLKPDGYYDMAAYRSALDAWSIELLGNPLHEVAERIAQEEGF